MLKLLPLVTTGCGLLLALPSAVLQDADLSSLSSALRETERAIEVLRGVESRIGAGDREAARLVLGLTEPPALQGPEVDQELERLRAEVNLLQAEVDVIEGLAAGLPPGPLGPLASDVAPPAAAPPVQAGAEPVRTGLDPALLAALRPGAPRSAPDPAAAAQAQPAPAEPRPAQAAPSPEEPGYSADPIRHAEACLLAGRLQEGFALIEARNEPEAVALRARFLERLGRVDEAIAALESVVGRLPEGYPKERAASDLEFLRWKKDFLSRLPSTEQAR